MMIVRKITILLIRPNLTNFRKGPGEAILVGETQVRPEPGRRPKLQAGARSPLCEPPKTLTSYILTRPARACWGWRQPTLCVSGPGGSHLPLPRLLLLAAGPAAGERNSQSRGGQWITWRPALRRGWRGEQPIGARGELWDGAGRRAQRRCVALRLGGLRSLS